MPKLRRQVQDKIRADQARDQALDIAAARGILRPCDTRNALSSDVNVERRSHGL